jgi:hypothetical protein
MLLLAYISPSNGGRTWSEFFRSKSLVSFWGVQAHRILGLQDNFTRDLAERLLRRIDQMEPLLTKVKALVEVRRDREYYGTKAIAEGDSRELLFHGIHRDTSVQTQAYLEDLKT